MFDEAQWLKRALKTLRALWLDERLRVALAFVGGPEFAVLINSEPMLKLRVVENVEFKPLSVAEVLEWIPQYHPIWTSAEERVIALVNRMYANGRFRLWANATRLAVKRCAELGEETVTPKIAASILSRLTR